VPASAKPPNTGKATSNERPAEVPDTPKIVYDDSLRHPVHMVAVRAEPLSGPRANQSAEQAMRGNGKDRMSINCEPRSLALDISKLIEAELPRLQERDIEEVRGQLQAFEAEATPELIVESFCRCLLTDWLQREYEIGLNSLPGVVNSSHRAARLICNARPVHPHWSISPAAWETAWQRLRPGVDIYVPNTRGGRSLKRADLYVVTAERVVSIEFKYVEGHVLRDPKGVAEQMQRFVEHHDATILVIYSGSNDRSEVRGVAQVRRELPGVPIVLVRGRAIPS
jgi:hypothetical protein